MPDWQLIDDKTPRDGSWFLARRVGTVIPFVTARCDDDGWFTFNRCFETTIGGSQDRKWEPTHWMPLPESDWQDISTAPRDREIILGRHGSATESGFWHDGSENYYRRAGWYAECDRGNLLTARPWHPTHWQPFPEPPNE